MHSKEQIAEWVECRRLSDPTIDKIEWGTCYPLVESRDSDRIIGVVCAEDGGLDDRWGEWESDGNKAWRKI